MNDDSEFLMLSGLKHFCFCKRRWALVHIEQQWAENVLTLEGEYMHERVHDAEFTEKRGSVLLSRGMPVRSERLRITGICDMVEMSQNDLGVEINQREGQWLLYPVEYKHGRPDPTGADELQLCAQAMCLEEMFVTDIPAGAIYYGETRRRQEVALTESLREKVRTMTEEMHRLFDRQYTPTVKMTKACNNCSLYEVCQPRLSRHASASEYVSRMMKEDGP